MPRPSSRDGLSPSRTKTKSGCLTCKKRRIKCDEAKPHCVKCTSTGRKCDGYGTLGPRSSNSVIRLPIHLPPILGISGSERENRSFQFFYERTVPSLSGYCGSEFWNRLVLQVSQHEKSIWHALIALGSLHENFENDQLIPGLWFSRQGRDPFAVQEYVSAIRALIGPPNPASRDGLRSANLTVDVCLISCVLFACFEILSSHYDSAISHIRSGIKIFNEVHYDPNLGIFCHPFLKPSTVTNLEMESLWRMLTRLQAQALTLTREDVDKQLLHSSPGRHSQHIEIPEVFRSVAEARDIFEYYNTKFSYDVRELVGDEEAQPSSAYVTLLRGRYEPLLGRWSIALENFERERGQHLTPREKNGLKILKIHQFMQFILLEYSKLGDTSQTSWDRFNPMFEEVIALGASVVDSTHGVECLSLSPTQLAELPRGGRLRPTFSLDMGIVAQLYNVAALCRDPIIRRKAVSVLRSASLQEGVFNSHVCAVFAEQIIAIEEAVASGKPLNYQTELGPLNLFSGLKEQEQREITESSQVPDTARLSYAYPTVNTTDKKVFLTFGRGKGMRVDIPLPAMTAMLDMET